LTATPDPHADGNSKDPAATSPRAKSLSVGVIAALAAIAIALAAISLFVPSPQPAPSAVTRVGPVSTSAGETERATTPTGSSRPRPLNLDVSFSFRLTRVVSGDTIFQIGSGPSAMRARVEPEVFGTTSIALSARTAGGTPLNLILVGQASVAHTYTIRIESQQGRSLQAWTDDLPQFAYSYGSVQLRTSASPVVIGGGAEAGPALDGSVSGFLLSYSAPAKPVPTPSMTALALRVAACLCFALAVVLLALRLASSLRVLRLLGLSTSPQADRKMPSRRVTRLLIIGELLLLVCGVAAVVWATPPQNSTALPMTFQRTTTGDVGPGTWRAANVGTIGSTENARVVDLHLSFEMQVPSIPIIQRRYSRYFVATPRNDKGIAFSLTRKGVLTGWIGQQYSTGPVAALISQRIPAGTWISLAVDVERNQYFSFSEDGQQVSAFTFALPDLNAVSPGLLIGGGPGGTFSGSVRDVVMTQTIYQPTGSTGSGAVRRGAQILGVVAIGVSIFLLARRFLRTMIPAAPGSKRSLVLVTFGTAGVLVAVNLVVDLLHLQTASSPAVARNTWLFAPYAEFSDFLQVFDIFKGLSPYGVQGGTYPPVGYSLVSPLSWMSSYAALFVFLAVFVGFFLWWSLASFGRNLRAAERVLVVAVLFLSLPVSIAIDRGNTDLWLFILLVFGIAAFERQRNVAAASWLGLLTAAKVYPVAYLLFFVRGRRWRYLALGLAIAGAATFAAFFLFDGTLAANVRGFLKGLNSLEGSYGSSLNSTYYNASVEGWIQAIAYVVNGVDGLHAARQVLSHVTIYSEVLTFALLAWYLRYRERSLWRGTTLITLWILLVPDVVYYYELLFLLIPLAMFVKYAPPTTRSIRMACLFGLAIAPKSYFYFGTGAIDVSVLLVAPTLIALACGVVYDGIAQRRDDRTIRFSTESLILASADA